MYRTYTQSIIYNFWQLLFHGMVLSTERWLNQRGIRYEAVDVISDEAAFDEMIRLSGQELVPVLDVDGRILADFGPEQLAEFWRKLEK